MNELPTSFDIQKPKTGPLPLEEKDSDLYSKYLRSKPEETTNNGSDSESDNDSDSEDEDHLPTTHEYKLPITSNKPITCLQFTSSGEKLIVSSRDESLNIYDFSQMLTTSEGPSTSLEPFENNYIESFKINANDGNLLAISNSPFFKVLDTKGKELHHFNSGIALVDPKQSTGHYKRITSCDWNPTNGRYVITSSEDSSFRIWDVTTQKSTAVAVIKKTSQKAVTIHQVRYTCQSKNIITIDSDEQVLIWDSKSNLNRPIDKITTSSPPSSVVCINDTQILLRTKDELKLYDLRNLANPMIQRLNFPTEILKNAPITVNGRYALAETSNGDDHELHLLDLSDLVTVDKIKTESQIRALDWNKDTNQIAIGYKNGSISVLFDPVLSNSGVLNTINNRPKKRNSEHKNVFIGAQTGYNLEELAELQRSRKKQRRASGDSSKKGPEKQKLIWGVTNPEKN